MKRSNRHTHTRDAFTYFLQGVGGALNLAGDSFEVVYEQPKIAPPKQAVRRYWTQTGRYLRKAQQHTEQDGTRIKQVTG